MKVSELIGRDLDYWVARAEGYEFIDTPTDANGENAGRVLAPRGLLQSGWVPAPTGKYGHINILNWSTDWAHGGPIIARALISVSYVPIDSPDVPGEWAAYGSVVDEEYTGPTPLIAAMRRYVASVFGAEVQDEVTG